MSRMPSVGFRQSEPHHYSVCERVDFTFTLYFSTPFIPIMLIDTERFYPTVSRYIGFPQVFKGCVEVRIAHICSERLLSKGPR